MNQCEIIQDLIPLYAEGLANEASGKLIEQHIATCSECHSCLSWIKEDIEQQQANPKSNNQPKINELVSKLAKYQSNIKLVGALTAILLACIVAGATVPFLSTLPLLIIVPFICRLFVHQSLVLIVSTIPFGILGGVLSENDGSFIPFFTIVALLLVSAGVGGGALWKQSSKQSKIGHKLISIVPALALIVVGSVAYCSFWGNPVGYVEAMIKTKNYVNETYEEGTLSFRGVSYNFKDNKHYGRFEYVLNGNRQVASIGFYSDGQVIDYYKERLEMQFADERSADFKAEVAGAIDHIPVYITADPETELQITQDELNNRYYHLSYDLERRNKAAALRESESHKLNYWVTFGSFSEEYDMYTKDQFMEKATAMLLTLKERNIPYHQVHVGALNESGDLQTVSLLQDTSPEQLEEQYKTVKRGEK